MQILDCTLRDGGYYTDWNFTSDLVETYLKTVSKLPISIVELGYLSDNKDLNGPFYHLSKSLLTYSKKHLNKNQKIYAMINSKEIKNKNHLIKLIKKNEKFIDGIRFAISPFEVKKFLPIIEAAKKKFKNISFNINLMYLNKWYKDITFAKKIINLLGNKINTVALVDSYGAMLPEQIYDFVKKVSNKNVKLGCHFHNNCGLALANTFLSSNEIVWETVVSQGNRIKERMVMKLFIHKFNHFLDIHFGMGHMIDTSKMQRNQVNVQDIRFDFYIYM